MKQRLARIITLAIFAPFLAAASIGTLVAGEAGTGRYGGFQVIKKSQEPVLYWLYALGGLVVSAIFLFTLWKEIAAFRAWRRFEAKHPKL